MYNLKNRTTIITGGASGIGKATVFAFAKAGANVQIIDVNQANVDATLADLKSQGLTATAHICDISKQTEVRKLFTTIGDIHILVNNAGIAHIGRADTTSEDDFQRVMDVNVKGVYNCIHEAIPIMKKLGGGVILNMASVAAQMGIADRFAYSTSKGAIYAMTLSVAKDYLADNIRCNSVSPGRVHTPFVDGFLAKNYPGKEQEMFDKLSKTQPIGRMGTPDEVAHLVLYLCSDEASFITGTDYPIDGGFIKLNT
ncbi:SDR family oxidoreductase [uncultured Imperialibacter sp.]|uniref:SDR family NAD(P)-dependent oxidoreductase n=1 Tax=uncultured Imperialibacter sp. TaxID=1672639 RepID=UPI0030DBA6F4|tara:strand:- start:16216 stop:16980 length:765 start_codon:yes stop_codon:yes gene_type:complete